jgi:hypothetical protein
MAEDNLVAVKDAWKAVRETETKFRMRLGRQKRVGGWGVLAGQPEGDIEAIAFLVLLEASKSARSDLKGIMDQVKSINEKKKKLRETLDVARDKRPGGLPDSRALVDLDSFVEAIATLQVNAMVEELHADLDQMSEYSEMDQLRLQMAMDRLSKMMSTLSNLLKKLADTQSAIIQNMK